MSDVPVRLLREALREDAATAPSAACLDADRLAAWSGGRLDGADRAAAESHAASCARCQAMLAAMAITAPAPAARTWWRTGTYKWLGPLAAAAAAAVLWVAVPRTPIEPPALATRTSPIATTAPAPPEPRAADASNSQRATDLIAPWAPAPRSPAGQPRFGRRTGRGCARSADCASRAGAGCRVERAGRCR